MINNAPRMTRRLNYLQKVRPNSPQIAELQQRIFAKNNSGAAFGTGTPNVNGSPNLTQTGPTPQQTGFLSGYPGYTPPLPGETQGGTRTPYTPPNTPMNQSGQGQQQEQQEQQNQGAQQQAANNFPRLRRRLAFLLKKHPNHPQILEIQKKLGITKDSPYNSQHPTGIDDKTGQINSGQVFNNAPSLNYDQDKAFGEAYNSAYNYITQDYANQKAQEMEAAKQELANRGIPLDPTEGSLYQKTLAGIDKKYTQLDDQAKNQAFLQGGQLYGTKAGASTDAFNAFINAIRGMSALDIQKYLGELSINQGGTPIIGGAAPGF